MPYHCMMHSVLRWVQEWGGFVGRTSTEAYAVDASAAHYVENLNATG